MKAGFVPAFFVLPQSKECKAFSNLSASLQAT